MQLLFADPIVTDPHLFAHELKSHCHQKSRTAFQTDLGTHCWQVWIQVGPKNEAFCIQYIETRHPAMFCYDFNSPYAPGAAFGLGQSLKVEFPPAPPYFTQYGGAGGNSILRAFASAQMPFPVLKGSFKEAIKQNPFAGWLNEVFQRHLSPEYSLLNSMLKVDQVLHLSIDPAHPSQGFDLCYLLPLLPHKVDAHLEYCRAAMNEKKEPTIAACKSFGMVDLKKWIQVSPLRSYVLYYQKMAEPIDQDKEDFLALKDDPKALQATQTLRDQTGLTFEELSPLSSSISLFP
jgi:hypothetical protein